jgi:hypothetical protein
MVFPGPIPGHNDGVPDGRARPAPGNEDGREEEGANEAADKSGACRTPVHGGAHGAVAVSGGAPRPVVQCMVS